MANRDRVRPCKFFRSRLLSCRTAEAVQGLIDEHKKQMADLSSHITSVLWYMRGGMTREEAWTLSAAERKQVMALIEERIKVVKDTGLPIL
jgi:hypothetical protein